MALIDLVTADPALDWEAIKRGIVTTLSETEIDDLREEATLRVAAKLRRWCRIDPDALTELDEALEVAILDWTRHLIFGLDAGAYRHVGSVKEGDTTVYFAGQSAKDAKNFFDSAIASILDYCGLGAIKKPKLKVVRQGPQDGAWA